MAGNATTKTGSYAVQRTDAYLDCPTGTSMLPVGNYVLGIATTQLQLNNAAITGTPASSIGDPNLVTVNPGDPIPQKTCGGNYQGQASYWDWSNGWMTKDVYGILTQVGYAATPNVVDVYLNASISKSIRW